MSVAKARSPQDSVYGPLFIPHYCWKIIDTPEFQRMRHILQLGSTNYVFVGATHTRFEHSLGCAHLAVKFMRHFMLSQPELNIQPEWEQAVVIAALCHDLGHGPWSHCFEDIAHFHDPKWDHEDMSVRFLKHIYHHYSPDVSSDVIDAACDYIRGIKYPKYPKWLSLIVHDDTADIDIDKFDYIVRDITHTIGLSGFEFERLMVNCRVIDDTLCWKLSEVPTIERLFFTRNDMHKRVYQEKTNQSITCMITDALKLIEPLLNIAEALNDPALFAKLDCRLLIRIEQMQFPQLFEPGACDNCDECENCEYRKFLTEEAKKAQAITQRIACRDLYKLVGELRFDPKDAEEITYSKKASRSIEQDIAKYGNFSEEILHVVKMKFRYGLTPSDHPLKKVPFYKNGSDQIITLQSDDISCMIPENYMETALRVFITDSSYLKVAKEAFAQWKAQEILRMNPKTN